MSISIDAGRRGRPGRRRRSRRRRARRRRRRRCRGSARAAASRSCGSARRSPPAPTRSRAHRAGRARSTSAGTLRYGPAASAAVRVWTANSGAASPRSAAQVAASIRPLAARSRAFWNAATARRMLALKRPSISPGENQARSSRIWARTTAGPLDADRERRRRRVGAEPLDAGPGVGRPRRAPLRRQRAIDAAAAAATSRAASRDSRNFGHGDRDLGRCGTRLAVRPRRRLSAGAARTGRTAARRGDLAAPRHGAGFVGRACSLSCRHRTSSQRRWSGPGRPRTVHANPIPTPLP